MLIEIGQDTIGYYVRVIAHDGSIHQMEVGIKSKKQARQIATTIADRLVEQGEAIRLTDKT